MKDPAHLQLDVRPLPSLKTEIDHWLAARKNAEAVPSDRNQHAYNASLFALGEAWAEQYPESADTPDAFDWFRRGLIAPEFDE
jgi:hypothetical protein